MKVKKQFGFILSQVFREPKLDPQIVTKFLPALVSLMVDDDVRRLNARLPPDQRDAAITIIEHSGGPSPSSSTQVGHHHHRALRWAITIIEHSGGQLLLMDVCHAMEIVI